MAASSKAPKHDFAPEWLKIPDQENSRPSGSKSAENAGDKSARARRDDYYGSYAGAGYMYAPLQRQRSFENYYEDHRYSPQRFRHHSVDDDYYGPPYSYGYYNGYNYDKFSSHYRSQPGLFTDSKYTHPNARYPQQRNGVYPPYYDPYFYDCYGAAAPGPTDPYYSVSYARPPKRHFSGDKPNKGSEKEKEGKKNPDPEVDLFKHKEESLDADDFPSLPGDSESCDSKPTSASGVWEKPPSAKIVSHNHKSSNCDEPSNKPSADSKENCIRQQSSNIYKALVPNKGALVRKGSKDNMKKDINSNHSPIKSSSILNTPFKNNKDNNKEGSPTPPVEILSTRFVTQPKNLGDSKSEFLRALRRGESVDGKQSGEHAKELNAADRLKHKDQVKENGVSGAHGAASIGESPLVNGVNDLSLASTMDDMLLSSSLEAEQRLLREMGWNEADEEEYIITEDEKRECERLMQQLKEERNGFNKKVLPKMWSPQHLPLSPADFQADVALHDSRLTSDDSDSDLD